MPLLIRAMAPKFPLFTERNVVIFITPSWWGDKYWENNHLTCYSLEINPRYIQFCIYVVMVDILHILLQNAHAIYFICARNLQNTNPKPYANSIHPVSSEPTLFTHVSGRPWWNFDSTDFFLISSTYGASERQCFVTVPFSWCFVTVTFSWCFVIVSF